MSRENGYNCMLIEIAGRLRVVVDEYRDGELLRTDADTRNEVEAALIIGAPLRQLTEETERIRKRLETQKAELEAARSIAYSKARTLESANSESYRSGVAAEISQYVAYKMQEVIRKRLNELKTALAEVDKGES